MTVRLDRRRFALAAGGFGLAALAGCAAVFAKKACKELGISPAGIDIRCKPFAGPGGPLTLAKFKTEVSFPGHFSAEQRSRVLEAIRLWTVKQIVEGGAEIGFSVEAV